MDAWAPAIFVLPGFPSTEESKRRRGRRGGFVQCALKTATMVSKAARTNVPIYRRLLRPILSLTEDPTKAANAERMEFAKLLGTFIREGRKDRRGTY